MLNCLRIKNLALVEEAEIDLGPGLNVFTGETGAGKSVLVGALGLILGGRAQSDLVRSGADQAVVEAQLWIGADRALGARFDEAGISVVDGEVVVRREVHRNGRGRVVVNGQLVTVSMLQTLLGDSMDVTGQHEHVSLLRVETHVDILDRFAGLECERQTLERCHAAVVEGQARLDALADAEGERARRKDFIRFQLDEIDALGPTRGEVEHLTILRERLRNAESIQQTAQSAEAALYSGDGAVVERLGWAEAGLRRVAAAEPKFAEISSRITGLVAEVEELARELTHVLHGAESDPMELEQTEDRLEALKRVGRKHGGDLDAVLAARETLAAELALLDAQEENADELSAHVEEALAHRTAAAAALTRGRVQAKKRFEVAVQKELAELSMATTRLLLELSPLAEPGPKGAERVEILISTNTGEPARALRRVASGGELSRVMLAIKQLQHASAPAGTMVFDEVDTGIGGSVADVLGQKLQSLGRHSQVLCVTHLPQVAAYADVHLKVEKGAHRKRTVTTVHLLAKAQDAVDELTRMLGGGKSDNSRNLALELHTNGRGIRPAKRSGVRRSSGRRAVHAG